ALSLLRTWLHLGRFVFGCGKVAPFPRYSPALRCYCGYKLFPSPDAQNPVVKMPTPWLAGLADGAGQGQSAGAAQAFAIDGDERIAVRLQLLVLPAEQQRLKVLEVQCGQGALERAFRGHDVAAEMIGGAAA